MHKCINTPVHIAHTYTHVHITHTYIHMHADAYYVEIRAYCKMRSSLQFAICVGKSAPSLFDSLVETSLIGKYNAPVKGTAPPGATKVISTGQHPMIGIFNITKVRT